MPPQRRDRVRIDARPGIEARVGEQGAIGVRIRRSVQTGETTLEHRERQCSADRAECTGAGLTGQLAGAFAT
jgi:hypothetical protein